VTDAGSGGLGPLHAGRDAVDRILVWSDREVEAFVVMELGGDEILQRLAAAKARERETIRRASTTPSERELAGIAEAEAALRAVVHDIEATTSLREPSRVQRYVD
jgi:hypothetical protein